MHMSKPTLTVTKDLTGSFLKLIDALKNTSVLVGIPADSKSRDEGITNAQLLAINNFGSPANNIPARPVLQVGIRNAQDAIAEQFKKAGQTVLTKGQGAIDAYYERAGIIAAQSVKKSINDQDFDGAPGPSDATLRARKSAGFSGTKSLIVSGQMRNSITSVVVKG